MRYANHFSFTHLQLQATTLPSLKHETEGAFLPTNPLFNLTTAPPSLKHETEGLFCPPTPRSSLTPPPRHFHVYNYNYNYYVFNIIILYIYRPKPWPEPKPGQAKPRPRSSALAWGLPGHRLSKPGQSPGFQAKPSQHITNCTVELG